MRLFDQFPPVSTEEWMAKIRDDLKGADFEKKMIWRPVEGFEVMPFYREENLSSLPFTGTMPGEFPFLRGNGSINNSWYIRQDIDATDSSEANSKAIRILGRGVDSLCFVFPHDMKFSSGVLNTLLENIFLEAIEINFSPQGSAMELLEALKGEISLRGTRPALLKGSIETDPLGRLASRGKLGMPVNREMDMLADLVREALLFPSLKVLRINGSVFGNSGSSTAEELALSLSMGNEYLYQLTSRGISPDDAASSIGFTFGIGSGYFMEISRLRAARMLWAFIVKKYSPLSEESMKMNIHSVTTDWNKTVYDPYVNMLRTQTEAMSAIIGGVNSLTVKPFDSIFAKPGDFSERIARNQQLLLKEESHLDKIIDPSAGSYYVENLTSIMADKAWSLFLEVEERGGFLEALRQGYIQDMVENTRSKRMNDVARGKEKLLGTNIFPNSRETIPVRVDGSKARETISGDTEVKPLISARAAEEFEQLRKTTDSSGRRPRVFMLTIGNVARSKARSQFASGFFAVAGYEVIDNTGFKTVSEGVEMALESDADIVVLCSSDEEYEIFGPEAQSLINGRMILVIAGAPACSDELRKTGIEHFISIKSNLLETLKGFNNLLQVGQF